MLTRALWRRRGGAAGKRHKRRRRQAARRPSAPPSPPADDDDAVPLGATAFTDRDARWLHDHQERKLLDPRVRVLGVAARDDDGHPSGLAALSAAPDRADGRHRRVAWPPPTRISLEGERRRQVPVGARPPKKTSGRHRERQDAKIEESWCTGAVHRGICRLKEGSGLSARTRRGSRPTRQRRRRWRRRMATRGAARRGARLSRQPRGLPDEDRARRRAPREVLDRAARHEIRALQDAFKMTAHRSRNSRAPVGRGRPNAKERRA